MKYDVIVIGAGPGGIFSAYELVQKNPDLKIAVFEAGHAVRAHFRMENIILQMILAVRFMSILARNNRSN